jgi:NAD(P)-dependent dehydrogenase (short-subunit alcohol dehydrogenase family)
MASKPSYGPVSSFTLKDKIVLITGGGSGIGLQFAKTCNDKGARVIIGDLKLTSDAEQYISSRKDKDIVFEKCDVTSWSDLHDLITASVKAFGDVPDVYAPVAGVLDPSWSNFWDDTEKTSYKTVEINTIHPIKLTRLAIKALLSANKKGVVCLVASSAGIRGNFLWPIYASTKHSIVGLCKSLGQTDPEQGVKIVCVLPGTVKSPLWEDRDDNVVEATRYAERKLMGPEVIAELMGRMVEEKEYSGGTCVLKTIAEERIVEEGWDHQAGKYDPSPRPEADMSHQYGILEGERGKKWS